MTGSVAALARKELAQHWVAALVLLALLGLSLVSMTLALAISDTRLSYLELLPAYLRGPVAILAFILAGRLVATEYYARTQRFVEALPVRRAEATVVKFLLGLALVWLAAGLGIAVALSRASAEGGVSASAIALVCARAGAAAFAVWCFAFATGFLGRLRIALIVLSVAVLVIVEIHTDIELQRFGPVALTDPRLLPFEHETFPVRPFLESIGLGAACLVVAAVLAALREGSVVETLARPMSHRETTFVLLLCLLALYGLFFANEAREPEPFRFTGPFVERSDIAPVAINYLASEHAEAGRALRERAERWHATLAEDLGPQAEIPALFIALSPARRHGDVRTTRLERDSVVLTANFLPGADYEPTEVAAHAIHQILSAMNEGRLFVEPKHWLADGMAQTWAVLAQPEPERPDDRRRYEAQAIAASELTPLDATLVHEWDRTLERVGDAMALALAYDGVRFLAERHGIAARRALARELLARPVHGDVRDWLSDRRHALPAAFERRTGERWPDFLAAWRADLARRRAGSSLPSIAALDAEIAIEVSPGGERTLRAAVASPSAPDEAVQCRLLHTTLPVFDRPLAMREPTAVRFLWLAGERGVERRLHGEYGAGERAFAALECTFPWLGAPARLAAKRMVVP